MQFWWIRSSNLPFGGTTLYIIAKIHWKWRQLKWNITNIFLFISIIFRRTALKLCTAVYVFIIIFLCVLLFPLLFKDRILQLWFWNNYFCAIKFNVIFVVKKLMKITVKSWIFEPRGGSKTQGKITNILSSLFSWVQK